MPRSWISVGPLLESEFGSNLDSSLTPILSMHSGRIPQVADEKHFEVFAQTGSRSILADPDPGSPFVASLQISTAAVAPGKLWISSVLDDGNRDRNVSLGFGSANR